MKTIAKLIPSVMAALLICSNMTAQEEVIKTVLPINGEGVQVLAIDLASDTAETHDKWIEYATKKGQFTSDIGTAKGKESLNGTLAHVGEDLEGLVQYEVMIVSMPDGGSGMSIALKTPDGQFIPEMDDTSLNNLRQLLEEFSTYVNTGFMKEDAVPDENMPDQKIKDMRPAGQ